MLKPTQADREAAALHHGYKSVADQLYWGRSGEWRDIDRLADKFAAHRNAALEEAAALADCMAKIGMKSPFWDAGQAQMFVDHASAIRAMKAPEL